MTIRSGDFVHDLCRHNCPTTMKHLLAILTLALASFACHARCTSSDVWSGDDKNLHFAAGVVIAGIVTTYTSDPWAGFYTSTAVGYAKELADTVTEGECSLQDFVVTAAGSALGAYMGNFVIKHNQGRTVVTYAAQF